MASNSPISNYTLPDVGEIERQVGLLARERGGLKVLEDSREAYTRVLEFHDAAIKLALEKAANQAILDATNLEMADLNRFDVAHNILSPTQSLQLLPLSEHLKGVYPSLQSPYCLQASFEGLEGEDRENFLEKLSHLKSSHPNVGIQVTLIATDVYVVFYYKPIE